MQHPLSHSPYRAEPCKSPSPDTKNKNRIKTTSIETSNVKKYLQTIKRNHKANQLLPANVMSKRQVVLHQGVTMRQNQQRLRKRIFQLEVQNNQFRIIAKECEGLARRNRELEEQMVLLMNQIEEKGEQNSTFREEGRGFQSKYIRGYKEQNSTKQKFYTEDSKGSEIDPYQQLSLFKLQTVKNNRIRTQPFKEVTLDENSLLEENSFLKAQNKKIKELVDSQVKQAMLVFEEKFMGYVTSIEQKLGEMKKQSEEIVRYQIQSSLHPSAAKENKQVLHKSSSSSLDGLRMQSLKVPTRKPQKRKQSSQFSLVNIELESQNESDHSFGRSKTRKTYRNVYMTPESAPKSVFKELYQTPPQQPLASKFTQIVKQRVYENIESIRESLTFILGEKSKINEPHIQQFQKRVYALLRDLISTFFSQKLENKELQPQERELMNENRQMKVKIRELTQDIASLQAKLKIKVDQECNYSSLKLSSDNLPSQSRHRSLPIPASSSRFEQTQRRLIRVIQIMKSFNTEYQNMLLRSRALSQPDQSSTPIYIQ